MSVRSLMGSWAKWLKKLITYDLKKLNNILLIRYLPPTWQNQPASGPEGDVSR
jgi:hypothetical protein